MEIINLPLKEIVPYKRNPRNNDGAVSAVAESIKQCGYCSPIIIDEDNVILCGHTRLKALKKLGYEEVECVRKEGMTEEQKQKYRILDNKTAELAEWNFDLLEQELKDLDFGDFDFGFDMSAFDEPQEIVEDEPPEVDEENEPITQLGDIWQLGEHRLMCGDSTSEEDVAKLMNGVKADMVFTDPPYGVDYKGINNDSRDGLSDLLNGAFESAMQNTKQGGVVYCFHSDKCADIFQDCFRRFCHFSSTIIWKKSALVLSQTDYQSIHEPCLYGWFNNGTHNFYGDRKQTSVWEFDRENIDGHTTPKPIGFIAKALHNSSREDEVVLDVFGGSGSTLIACEQLNRKCFMMELDPKYVDVIIKRWEELTGKKAVKIN